MQFSLNKKISDKTSQNKDLSQCDSDSANPGTPKVQSIFWGPHILKKAHQDDVLFLLYETIYGREPNRTVGVRT